MERTMRIAQVAPLAESVPPKLYGGTERVVAWLIEDLVELGHEVTLFASGDSKTRAKLVPAWPRALRLGRPRSDPAAAQAALLEAIARQATDFDVIHAHTDWLPLPPLSRLGVPFLTTVHGRLDFRDCRISSANFLKRLSFRSRTISALRLPKRTGWAQCTMAFRCNRSIRPIRPAAILPFLAGLTADKGPEA